MDLAVLSKLVHVLVGFGLIAGIVGRTFAIRQAPGATISTRSTR